MAEDLEDGVFWLPSEFLTDDDEDSFVSKKSSHSSPVESVIGSIETESDEDELIAFLNRSIELTTKVKLSGSPQSPLCAFKSVWSTGSSKCVSRVSSPPIRQEEKNSSWDLLYAAAEEVKKMRMAEEETRKSFSSLFKSNTTTVQNNPVPSSGFYPQTRQSYQQFQGKQQEIFDGGVWGQEKIGYGFQNVRTQDPQKITWPSLQRPQQKPVMRAVFLNGENGVKKERTGTGVFIPRRYNTTPVETQKKQGGSTTVLLPERVVQALNLNLDSINAQARLQTRVNNNFTNQYDAALKRRNDVLMAQQRINLRSQAAMNQELWLPQEWTY